MGGRARARWGVGEGRGEEGVIGEMGVRWKRERVERVGSRGEVCDRVGCGWMDGDGDGEWMEMKGAGGPSGDKVFVDFFSDLVTFWGVSKK